METLWGLEADTVPFNLDHQPWGLNDELQIHYIQWSSGQQFGRCVDGWSLRRRWDSSDAEAL